MTTKHIVGLLALLCLLSGTVNAKSPWDKSTEPTDSAPAETVTTEPDMAEPVVAESIPAEPEVVAEDPAPINEPAPAHAATESIEIIETSGDVLAMPQASTGPADTSPILLLDFPRRGMDQEKVQSELGSPIEIQPAVGQPPITRWIYNDRVVYFERSTVLHVVAR